MLYFLAKKTIFRSSFLHLNANRLCHVQHFPVFGHLLTSECRNDMGKYLLCKRLRTRRGIIVYRIGMCTFGQSERKRVEIVQGEDVFLHESTLVEVAKITFAFGQNF